MIIQEANTFVVKHVNQNGLIITWKTLNKADRLSLLDTDERAKDMPRLRILRVGGVQVMKYKGLTIGPN